MTALQESQNQINAPPGYREPVAKPLNCNCGDLCCYGKDRAYCFPCYRNILNERRAFSREKKEYGV